MNRQSRQNTLYRVSQSSSKLTIDENVCLGILQHLNLEQLKALDETENKLEELINDDAQSKQSEQDKELLIAANKSLAEYNLSLRPLLDQVRDNLSQTYDRAENLKAEYDRLKCQVDKQNAKPSLETAYDMLRFAAQESEETTDALGEAFLREDLDCDSFLKTFIENRASTHLLKIKAEKLGEMISRRH